ncbi:caveolin-2 [Osmerus mordax]|uniref:caveolin-2 n=1 Tax=Osmerus mordax TaxID=8014 RepID=UPI00350F19C6
MDTMMKEDDTEETEIDLGDSEPEDSDELEEPEPLWKAPAREEEEEDMTSALVDISDTKPLLNIRDPRGINDCLKVTFEDVIAEPVSVRSGDRVWMWSNALFEVTRVWIYRIVTVLLAVPVSILSGLLFAILSCLHIWMVSPFIQSVLISTSCLQAWWSIVLDVAVRPFLSSAGKCCGGISVHLARE